MTRTTNTKEDVEFMLSWLDGLCAAKREGKHRLMEIDKQVIAEIKLCIKSTQKARKPRK